jgi:hypothetical protein
MAPLTTHAAALAALAAATLMPAARADDWGTYGVW